MGLYTNEAEVARRLDAGQTRKQIEEETDIAGYIIDRVAGWSSPMPNLRREAAIREGTRNLVRAIAATGREFA